MEPSDWRRVLLCGLVTGLVWTLLSVTLLAIVGTEFLAAVASARPETPGPIAQAFPFLANLAVGDVAVHRDPPTVWPRRQDRRLGRLCLVDHRQPAVRQMGGGGVGPAAGLLRASRCNPPGHCSLGDDRQLAL